MHTSGWPVKSDEGAVTEREKIHKYSVTEAQWEECDKKGVDSCQILQRDWGEWRMKRYHRFQSCVLISTFRK